MQLLEIALTREQEAETYYRDLAGKSKDLGLRNIMLSLAEAEVRHQRVIRGMHRTTGEAPALISFGAVRMASAA